MRKSFLYLLLAVVALSVVFMSGGRSLQATQNDNVTYTMPYMNTTAGGDKSIYCIISNRTNDNASIHFNVSAVAAGSSLTSQLINLNTLSNYAIVYARQTRMLSFEGMTINVDGIAMGSVAVAVPSASSYGGRVMLVQMGTLGGSGTGASWSCTDLPMACFQGSTNPKRNLVGYICSDPYTPQTNYQQFTY
ncbi:MAG: hypothetical protein L7F77_14920 [Candidatus Magnetominusculus sp. LBB02]|nr:hypothetical protein [Candidatus Magnetominusculus sp. LBB02]